MNTIDIDKAKKEFRGTIRVGEYVAWWVSADGQHAMNAVTDSFPTIAECEADAASMLDDKWLADDFGRTLRETGYLTFQLVTQEEED